MQYKGFTIELSRDRRSQWRVRLRKADGLPIRSKGEPEESDVWISSPYMDRNHAIEQVRALIDAGGVR